MRPTVLPRRSQVWKGLLSLKLQSLPFIAAVKSGILLRQFRIIASANSATLTAITSAALTTTIPLLKTSSVTYGLTLPAACPMIFNLSAFSRTLCGEPRRTPARNARVDTPYQLPQLLLGEVLALPLVVDDFAEPL